MGARADEADDPFDVERVDAPRNALFLALDDFAVVIHLPEPPLGVALGCGHDQNVLDPLAMLGPDVEAIANHDAPPDPVCPPRGGWRSLPINGLDGIADTLGRILHANIVPV